MGTPLDSAIAADRTPCASCPLRSTGLFHTTGRGELEFIESLKRRELRVEANRTIIDEGQADTPLYTLLRGWAFRYKTLSDGRRQILNILLPGDFMGVQQNMSEAARHGVMALTAVVLCVFQRDALWAIHKERPMLGFDVTWLTAQGEAMVDENLLSVGRRSAIERIAMLLVSLYARARWLESDAGDAGIPFPLTQQHIADALGLSLVHTNKSLRKLERLGLHTLRNGRLLLRDVSALARIAEYYGTGRPVSRPLI